MQTPAREHLSEMPPAASTFVPLQADARLGRLDANTVPVGPKATHSVGEPQVIPVSSAEPRSTAVHVPLRAGSSDTDSAADVYRTHSRGVGQVRWPEVGKSPPIAVNFQAPAAGSEDVITLPLKSLPAQNVRVGHDMLASPGSQP